MNKIDLIRNATINGHIDVVCTVINEILLNDVSPDQILNEGLISAMIEVGELFEKGEYYLPEMLLAGRAMKAAMKLIKPYLVDTESKPIGKVILGTVQGDIHNIGKNLVGIMLEGVGFQVVDLGVDVPPQRFLDAVGEHRPDIVGISAMLSTTMPKMKDVVNILKKGEISEKTIIMVGGAPVTKRFADEIGAHLYAPDAASASRIAKEAIN